MIHKEIRNGELAGGFFVQRSTEALSLNLVRASLSVFRLLTKNTTFSHSLPPFSLTLPKDSDKVLFPSTKNRTRTSFEVGNSRQVVNSESLFGECIAVLVPKLSRLVRSSTVGVALETAEARRKTNLKGAESGVASAAIELFWVA